jgi:hypothetical protein
MAALWPDRCKGLVSVSGYLIGNQKAGSVPLPPKAELEWWYQYYFATERGRAGYNKYRKDFANLIWQIASPKWNFDDATFERTAAAFDNPDHVDIVINNYRWRLGLAQGEAKYDDLERRLATAPVITVPTRSRWKAMPTGHHTQTQLPTQKNSQVDTNTERSGAASDTICPKRPRRRLRRP